MYLYVKMQRNAQMYMIVFWTELGGGGGQGLCSSKILATALHLVKVLRLKMSVIS